MIDVIFYQLLADGDNTGDSGGTGIGLVGLIVLRVGAILYFVPTIVAATRKVRNLGSVIVINLFLGWTFIGWIVALAMAARTVDREAKGK
jgi:hypothetical protein